MRRKVGVWATALPQRVEVDRTGRWLPVGKGFWLLGGGAVAAVFALLSLGGAVRVTESGLGCPDWPLCYGRLVPPLEFHTLMEYSHRLVASLAGLLVAATAALAWWRYRSRGPVLHLATVAVVAVVAEAGLGGVTVLTELPGAVVAAHLLLGLSIFGLLVSALVLAGAGRWDGRALGDPMLGWSLGAAAVVLGVAVSGSYVVAAGAGTACPEWPLCASGGVLPWGGPAWVHMSHRVAAGVGGLLALGVGVAAWRRGGKPSGMGRMGLAVALLVVAQVLVGAANPWTGFAAAAQVAHLSLTTGLWGALVAMACLAYRRAAAGSYEDGVEHSPVEVPPERSRGGSLGS